MKKYLRLSFFMLFLLFSTNYALADDCPPWVDPSECGGGGGEGLGDGTGRKTPIDDYASILVITAVTIAGIISYRQRQLIKK